MGQKTESKRYEAQKKIQGTITDFEDEEGHDSKNIGDPLRPRMAMNDFQRANGSLAPTLRELHSANSLKEFGRGFSPEPSEKT